MLFPNVIARIKQIGPLSCLRVDARDIWPLAAVALQTAKSQVFQRRRPVVLLRNDVVDLESLRIIRLRSVAILTQSSGTRADGPIKCLFQRHQAADELVFCALSEILAFD